MSQENLALKFKAATTEEWHATVNREGVETTRSIVPTETVFVRHRIHRDRLMRVTGVDEERGRWVCCAYEILPGTWQHDLIPPADLEEVERKPRG